MSEKTFGNLKTVLITTLVTIVMLSLSVNAYFLKSELSDQKDTDKEIIEQIGMMKLSDSNLEKENSNLRISMEYIIKAVDEMRIDIKEIKKK